MTQAESFASGRPLSVDISAVERELKALWMEASGTSQDGVSPAVTRACQLNLIVCCSSRSEEARATSSVAALARGWPSRVLMAVIDPAIPGEALRASITAHCAYAAGAGRGKQVCCEQVTIACPPAAAARLPAAVLPLLLPDLPVAIWFPGDPRSVELEAPAIPGRLAEAVDRVVVDSRRFADAARGLEWVESLGGIVADLAWHNLRGWREMIARQFDGAAHAGLPARVERIRVESGGPPGACPSDAVLLAAWTAARLGWRPAVGEWRLGVPGAALGARMARPGGQEGELIVACRGDGGPASIASVCLEAADVRLILSRSGSSDSVAASVIGAAGSSHAGTARVVERDEAALLWRALGASGRDAVYEEARGLAMRLGARSRGAA